MIEPTTDARAAAEQDTATIVESVIRDVSHIATLPGLAIEIIRLTEDPDSTADDMNKVIANDPALSARILKVVNSAFYQLPRQVGSIHRAILLLGLNAVKNIAIATSLDKIFRRGQFNAHFNANALWTHSIAVATGTYLVAEKADLGFLHEAFLAGLIHDLGIMVEMQARRREFVQVIEKLSVDRKLTFRHAEEQVLGATHEAFGAGLCRKWRFPPSLENVAGYHHRPLELDETSRGLVSAVYTADILAARIGAGYTRTVESETVDAGVLSLMNLDEADLETMAEVMPRAMQEAQLLLS